MFNRMADLPEREIVPGFRAKMIHTEHVTVAHWTVDAGAALPDHAHPHEQITMVQAGTFELTVNGETHVVEEGDYAVIPGQVRHSGKAITACRLVDVFYPTRDDYR
jgi:quercetin dioxygenase-like cupin family protein